MPVKRRYRDKLKKSRTSRITKYTQLALLNDGRIPLFDITTGERLPDKVVNSVRKRVAYAYLLRTHSFGD